MPDLDLKNLALTVQRVEKDAAAKLQKDREEADARALKLKEDMDRDYDAALRRLEAELGEAIRLNKPRLVIYSWVVCGTSQDLGSRVEARLRKYFTDLGVEVGTAGGCDSRGRSEFEFYVDVPSLRRAAAAALGK